MKCGNCGHDRMEHTFVHDHEGEQREVVLCPTAVFVEEQAETAPAPPPRRDPMAEW
jgi:hypothetical protein